jgi:hypothetical protein
MGVGDIVASMVTMVGGSECLRRHVRVAALHVREVGGLGSIGPSCSSNIRLLLRIKQGSRDLLLAKGEVGSGTWWI